MVKIPAEVRLQKYFVDVGPDKCWSWLGAVGPDGYGHFWAAEDDKGYAHRYVYEFLVGPIPDGLKLDHLCHNAAMKRNECSHGPCKHRSCVNPSHLDPTTQKENRIRARGPVCKNGHLYDNDNEYFLANGDRCCRTCNREANERWRQAHPREVKPHYQTLKTHCPQGHPYDEENTRYSKKGGRHCKACERQRYLVKPKRAPKPPKTHCRRGHEYTPANTRVDKKGHRTCRQCQKDKYSLLHPPKPTPPLPTQCINGHEFTPENIKKDKSGRRICRTCAIASQRKSRLKTKELNRQNQKNSEEPE